MPLNDLQEEGGPVLHILREDLKQVAVIIVVYQNVQLLRNKGGEFVNCRKKNWPSKQNIDQGRIVRATFNAKHGDYFIQGPMLLWSLVLPSPKESYESTLDATRYAWPTTRSESLLRAGYSLVAFKAAPTHL